MDAKFQFSNVVVVDKDQIGVIVKTWERFVVGEKRFAYEVYVRSDNSIMEYEEDQIQHFVYSKELLEEEKEFYDGGA